MKCKNCGNSSERILTTITDNNGSSVYCPNCLVEEFLSGNLNFENNMDFVDDITGEKGAVSYVSDGETYILEKEAMLRLISYNLDPDEYFALANKYGADKFMLHDDFYDSWDGGAVQPLGCYDDEDDDEYFDENDE